MKSVGLGGTFWEFIILIMKGEGGYCMFYVWALRDQKQKRSKENEFMRRLLVVKQW